MMTETIKYWCYNCSQQFVSQQHVEACGNCQSESIEIATDNNGFTPYEVYEIPSPSNQSTTSSNLTAP
ncbi:MAG: hypothetical protein KDD45_08480 [Bdellovibrionales bacterium]|nr:hypothetical protein [Bdellovibrionales bacterium]